MMSERKKIKIEKEIADSKTVLEKLKALKEDEYDPSAFENELNQSLINLKEKEKRPFAILSILQIFHLLKQNSENILSEDEIKSFFEAVLNTLIHSSVDISQVISSPLIHQLKDLPLILKFFESYHNIISNREILKQILTILIEINTENREMLVNYVIKNFSKFHDFIPRIVKFIDIEKIDENQYIKLFIDCPFFRENTEPKFIKGKKRLGFVEKAIEIYPDFVFKNYIKDKDQKIRQILAKNINFSYEPFFNILLNDSESEVRLSLLKRMDYSNIPLLAIDRVLDKSENVRNEMFRIYNECVYQLKACDGSYSLNVFNKTDNNISFIKEGSKIPLEILYEKFFKFFTKLSEGCLTGFSNEYQQILSKSNFTLDFLSKNVELTGVRTFLKNIEIVDFNEIPLNLQDFCLEYLFKGFLTDSQIVKCIENNVFQSLKFINDFNLFYDLLLDKALNLDDLNSVELIVENIKPILNKNNLIIRKKSNNEIVNKKSIDESFKDTIVEDNEVISPNEIHVANRSEDKSFKDTIIEEYSPNEIFINTHTSSNDQFKSLMIENLGSAVDYPHLYYFVYNCSSNPLTIQSINKSNLSLDQKIKLLVYLNSLEALELSVDSILKANLSYKTQQLLISKRTVTPAMIYFLSTGQIAISSNSFFIKAIKCCISSQNFDKVSFVFKKYISSLNDTVFDNFYSICLILKECTVSNISNEKNDSILLNPIINESIIKQEDCKVVETNIVNINDQSPIKISNEQSSTRFPTFTDTVVDNTTTLNTTNITSVNTENLTNAKPNTKIEKLKLTKKDKMLFLICNMIIGFKNGKKVDINFDPTKYGFYKLSEQNKGLIDCGQVIYE